MAVTYYESLFKAGMREGGTLISGAFPRIEAGMLEVLKTDVIEEEIKSGLNRMGSYKASGPDNYQSKFFKRTWSITGAVVHSFVRDVMKGGIPC